MDTFIVNEQSDLSQCHLQVDSISDSAWDTLVDSFSDASIYQTSAYGLTRWGSRGLSRALLMRGQEVLSVAQLRIARTPLIGSGVAYIRWAPLWQRKGKAVRPEILHQMLDALTAEYVVKQRLCLKIVPSAHVGTANGGEMLSKLNLAGYVLDTTLSPYRTVIVELGQTMEQIRRKLAQKWRNQLNRAEKNGLEVSERTDESAFSEFRGLYEDMLQRKQFETSVKLEEFEVMTRLLSATGRLRIFTAGKDGRTVGALVCGVLGNTAVYLLGATSVEARELKAAYLLHWEVMRRLKESEVHYYDLGGIDPKENPGGYHFKRGFGGEEKLAVAPHFQARDMRARLLQHGLKIVSGKLLKQASRLGR